MSKKPDVWCLVEGCSCSDLPDNMWLKHFENEALVGCKTGVLTTWLLKYERGTWEGQVGIYSSGSASAPAQLSPKYRSEIICYQAFFYAIFIYNLY